MTQKNRTALRGGPKSQEYYKLVSQQYNWDNVAMVPPEKVPAVRKKMGAGSYSADRGSQLTKEWYAIQNPGLAGSTDSVALTHLNILKDSGESGVFGCHALNGFLAEADDELTYGEFVEANYDALFQRTLTSKIQNTGHWRKALVVSSNSILNYRPNARSEARKAIDSITVAEARGWLARFPKDARLFNASSGSVAEKLQALRAQAAGVKNTLPPAEKVHRKMNLAFARSLGASSDAVLEYAHQASAVFFTQASSFYSKLYADPIHVKSGHIRTDEALGVVELLASNATGFTVKQLAAIAYAMGNPSMIARASGKINGLHVILAMKDRPYEEAVELLKLLANFVMVYNQVPPTANEWIKAIENGDLLFMPSVEIAMALITEADGDRVDNTFTLNRFRQSLINI